MAATATEPKKTSDGASTTTLKATMGADGKMSYEVPRRKREEMMRVYVSCRTYAHFPALQERADAAAQALALLMVDLGIKAAEVK